MIIEKKIGFGWLVKSRLPMLVLIVLNRMCGRKDPAGNEVVQETPPLFNY